MPNPFTLTLSSFLGVRNTNPARSIPNNALAAASDIDIDDAGILTRRNGYSLSKAITSVTSAYSTQEKTSYVVASGTLSRVDDSLNLVPITASTATAFADYGKNLFTNDGLRVFDDNAVNLNVPSGGLTGPALSSNVGDWQEGRYMAVFCYQDSITGLQGASSAVSTIILGTGQRVVIAPPPLITGYTAVVYITEANGTVFYDSLGSQLNPVFLLADSFPVEASQLAVYDSSLFAAIPQTNGSTLVVWSTPFIFQLFDYGENYFIVPGEVRDMMGTADGLIIATDAAIYAYNGGAMSLLANYGAPKGRSIAITPQGKVNIFTNRGVCEATPFINLTEVKALFAPGKVCSTALVDQGGIQKFVVLSDGSGVPYNIRS